MTGAPSNGRKKSKIGLSQKILQSLQKILQSLKVLPSQEPKVLPSQEPLPEVTAPRYSDRWMEEVDTRNQVSAIREGLRRRELRSAQESASQAASQAASAPAKTKPAKA